jgi:DNA-binding PucR family transcriptional regulator
MLSSYKEALHAATAARVVTSLRPVAEWSRLGVYRMLIRFPVEEIRREALPAGLSGLIDRKDGSLLADTLETYLDLAGSAAKAAKVLGLHRVSLYGRLRRIEDLTGSDLADGQQRLALHLGLKLARLAGLR